jgi:hypothetical protein
MAYDKYLTERIAHVLVNLKVVYTSKPMMGGYLFQVDGKMLCGVLKDKQTGDNLLMARIGEDAYQKEIHKPACRPMDFTGRPMKGYIFVTDEGLDFDKDLQYWIELALAFNPFAKASKKGKKR